MSEIAPLPPFVLDLFPPCEKGLLKRLAEDTSPAMLREIAMCDYGDGADENLSILTDIQATLILPSRLDWYPMEVLKLTQWFEPSKSTNDSQLVAKSGHLKRAFSCAILLMAGGDPANFDYMMGENDTLAQALVSCFYLGDLYAQLLGELMTWRYQTVQDYDSMRVFVPFAILILALKLHGESLTIEQSTELVIHLLTEENSCAEGEPRSNYMNRKCNSSFLGLELYDQRHINWFQYALQIRDQCSDHPAALELALTMLKDYGYFATRRID